MAFIDLPKQCPSCERNILSGRERPTPRLRTGAYVVMLAGAAATIVWCWLWSQHSPILVAPRSAGGAAVCAVVYGWPAVIAGWIASMTARAVTLRCRSCGWRDTFVET